MILRPCASRALRESLLAASAPRLWAAPLKSTRWHLREDALDVLAVTFGRTRTRDVERDLDLGLRAYPWVTYTTTADDAEGAGSAAAARVVYRNTETGAVTGVKPLDFDKRAPPSAYLSVNAGETAVRVYKATESAWEKTLAALGSTPIIQGMLELSSAVAAGPVGKAAGAVSARASELREDLQEKWETSQHPLVVNAAYIVDSVTAETEQGRAMRDVRRLDAGFDEFEFIAHVRDELAPTLARAFFRLDGPVLAAHCRETALAQMRAVSAARDIEGVTHDGTVLAVSKVELIQARNLEDERGGTLPLLLVSAHVQYIHCVRDKKGVIIEGSESEIRAAVFVIALTREFLPARGALAWRVVELAMHGQQMYL